MLSFLIVIFLILFIPISILLLRKGPTIDNNKKTDATIVDTETRYVESIKLLENLSQNANRRSYKGRVSITLNELILDENLKINYPIAKFKNEIAEIAAKNEVFFFIMANTWNLPADIEAVSNTFKEIIPPHRVLICYTREGLIGMIRQLNPRAHFECNPLVVESLIPHLKMILMKKEVKVRLKNDTLSVPRRPGILSQNFSFLDTFEEMAKFVVKTSV